MFTICVYSMLCLQILFYSSQLAEKLVCSKMLSGWRRDGKEQRFTVNGLWIVWMHNRNTKSMAFLEGKTHKMNIFAWFAQRDALLSAFHCMNWMTCAYVSYMATWDDIVKILMHFAK